MVAVARRNGQKTLFHLMTCPRRRPLARARYCMRTVQGTRGLDPPPPRSRAAAIDRARGTCYCHACGARTRFHCYVAQPQRLDAWTLVPTGMLVLRFLVLALAGAVAEDDDGATATANLRALSREALESILLESAAEHPGVAALLLRATTAAAPPFTVTAMSHSRVALDGDATPSAVGRLVTVHGTGFVVGAAALCNVTSTDSFEGFERGFAYDPEHVLQVAAKVVSPTSLTCLLPQVPTGGPARVMVSMDGGATFPLGRSANFTYFALLSFAVGRRPYTIEQTGKLIVGVAPELLQAAAATQSAPVPLVNLQAAATVEGAKPLQLALATTALSAPDSVLSFPLAALPAQLDAVVALTVSVKGGVTVTKRRRLVRVPLEPDQEAVIVDHHTRGLSIVKPNYHHNQQHRRELKPWLGTGWYMYGGFECQGQSHAPAIDWGNAPGPGNFSGHVDLLARRGFNQLMIYDLVSPTALQFRQSPAIRTLTLRCICHRRRFGAVAIR